MSDATMIRVRIGQAESAYERTFHGRAAWALAELIRAGVQGLTTVQRPAPRWSHYIFLLRRSGVEISTEHESHGGSFCGHHGRYRLVSPVEVLTVEYATGAA